MTESINFLKTKSLEIRKKAREAFLVEAGLIAVLVVYGLILAIVFSYYLLTKKEHSITAVKVEAAKNRVENLRSVETKQVYLKSKTKSLQEVLEGQHQHQKIANALFSLLPEEISISGFMIDDKGGVEFSAASKNFNALKLFLTKLEFLSGTKDMEVDKLVINGVTFDYEQGYSFKIYLKFKELSNG